VSMPFTPAVVAVLGLLSPASAIRSPTRESGVSMNLLKSMLGVGEKKFDPPVVMGDESIMAPKAHGTSATPVQSNLKYGCDTQLADRICNFNRHYAERAGYWETTSFISEAKAASGPIDFFDANSGKLLFTAPKGRSMEDFIRESRSHGWPSFRDEETNWEYVRVLGDGECVSVDGTHLGHNLPDSSGNRYCINLVSVAGNKK